MALEVLPDCKAEVTIIIPTLCNEERRQTLIRAVESVYSATARDIRILVCVNGSRRSDGLARRIAALPWVQCESLVEGSLPKTLAFARKQIATSYFGFLDDDDELLPGSIDVRLAALEDSPHADIAITNGFRQEGSVRHRAYGNLRQVESTPLECLFEQNWLSSCGALFRTATIGTEFFNDYHDFAEWTWLAFCMAMAGKKVIAVDQPGFIIHDTVDSRSKSIDHKESFVDLYQKMLRMSPPRSVARVVKARICSAYHDLAVEHLSQLNIGRAMIYHWRSLTPPHGLRYLTYSRHFVLRMIGASIVLQPR